MSSSSCPLGGGGTPESQRGGLPNRSRYGSHVLEHEHAQLSGTCWAQLQPPSCSLPLSRRSQAWGQSKVTPQLLPPHR